MKQNETTMNKNETTSKNDEKMMPVSVIFEPPSESRLRVLLLSTPVALTDLPLLS